MIPNYMHICHLVRILDGSASAMRKGVLDLLFFVSQKKTTTIGQWNKSFRDGDIGGFWVLMYMYIAYLIFYFVYG